MRVWTMRVCVQICTDVPICAYIHIHVNIWPHILDVVKGSSRRIFGHRLFIPRTQGHPELNLET